MKEVSFDQVVTTGIDKLDDLLMGGLPKGYTVLVLGMPGTGFELLAKQFASAGAAEAGENVVYYVTNENAQDVINTMKHFGWPTNFTIVDISTQYYEKVLKKELEVATLQREGVTISDIASYELPEEDILDEFRQINFLDEVLYDITSLEPPFRIVLDQLDFFLEHYNRSEVLAALRSVKMHVQNTFGTMMITLTSNADSQIQNAMMSYVDIVIELEIKRMASDFENRLIIRKVRNRPDKNAILYYSITEKGITPEMVMRVA